MLSRIKKIRFFTNYVCFSYYCFVFSSKQLVKKFVKTGNCFVFFVKIHVFNALFYIQDKEDEAGEILETIRWVCQDHPEIDEILDKNGAIGKFDPSSFEAMESLCNSYNKAVEKSLDKKVCKLVYLGSI